MADLRKVMKPDRHHSRSRPGRLAEHRALLAAIAAHDAAKATRLMRACFAGGSETAVAPTAG